MAVLGWGAYFFASLALALAVAHHALATREQFYPAVIYLVTSKFSVVVLANMAFVLIVALAKFLKRIFLGDLRQAEVEVRGRSDTWSRPASRARETRALAAPRG